MKRTVLMVTALLSALAGGAQAQTPADPIAQRRVELKAVDTTYGDKKKALDSERKEKVKAAGEAAAADAKAKGAEPGVARRNAEAKVKAATQADYDKKLKVIKKEQADATAAVNKKYPLPKS